MDQTQDTQLVALVVDDNRDFRATLSLLVGREGFVVREAGSLREARDSIAAQTPDVVLADLHLPDGDGLELTRDSETGGYDTIVITGNASVESAIGALRDGALDYLTKPVERTRLRSILRHVARGRALQSEIVSLRSELRDVGRFGQMVGRSPAMQDVYGLISRVAPTHASVLITGASGTGKELVASTIHRLSKRRDRPFLGVNMGAISSTLVESELFGHVKGSFTGAEGHRKGYFQEASGGTLFLDEITEVPPELQVKLLRVLETSSVMPVGTSTTVPVDVRVIAATNRDPLDAITAGRLREDLYYRLNVFPLTLPPLRERGEDVRLLAAFFLDVINERDETTKTWTAAALDKMARYAWPGNVRELKNLVERAAILADAEIGVDVLGLGDSAPVGGDPAATVLQVRLGTPLKEVERRIILATLQDTKGDKKRAAGILGVSMKTIYNRLNVYDARGAGPSAIERWADPEREDSVAK